jgi:hypothetical protein
MNKYLLIHGAFVAICAGAILPGSQTARAADVTAPSAASRLPINLARGDLGARLEVQAPKVKSPAKNSVEENESAQALISDDDALTYPLAPGQTSLIVILGKIEVLNSFNFVNFGAAGKYSISVSSTKLSFDAPGWRSVAKGESFDNAQVVSTDFGSAEARYVKIDFETSRPGRISGLGLFGAPTIGAFQKKPLGYSYVSESPGIAGSGGGESRNVYFDLANLDTGARVVALSRGNNLESAQAMIDGNVASSYEFEATDPAPAVVVDLGVRRSINRLSCVYQAPPGRLDFYLVDNPYRKDEPHATLGYVGEPTVEPISNVSGEYSGRSGTGGRQAIYSVDTTAQPGLNRLAADMPGQQGRFLVAEFHPLAPSKDFKDYKDYKDQADYKDRPDFKDQPTTAGNAPESQPLRILSLSAFGQVPGNEVVPQIPPPSGPQPPPLGPPGLGVNTGGMTP